MRPLHFLMAIFTLVLGGCVGGPPDIVGIVKAGTLPSHPTKTIGKAFDEAFPGGTWDAEMTGMGEMYAHFRSTATAEDLKPGGVPGIDHEICIDGVRRPCRVQVHFQFFLKSDNRTIELMFVEAPYRVVSEARLKALLAFVYR